MGVELIGGGRIENLPTSEDIPLIYTNSVQLKMSVFDMVLDLGVVASTDPERTVVKPVARVAMSPQHAKALAAVLDAHVKAYETAFGPLPDAPKVAGTDGKKSD